MFDFWRETLGEARDEGIDIADGDADRTFEAFQSLHHEGTTPDGHRVDDFQRIV